MSWLPPCPRSPFAAHRRLPRLGLALAAAGSLLLFAGCGDEPSAERPDPAAPPVEAVQARTGALPLVERLSGTVWAENQISLYPEITARIAEVHVENGATVEKGQPLVTLQDDQYREQLRQAEAGHRIAQARVRQAQARLFELRAQETRTRSLGDRQLVTALELDTLAAQVESAEADVELAEAQLEQAAATVAEERELLGRTVLRAPIAGLVGQRNAEVGMQATPSTRLFTIGNIDRMLVRVDLTDHMLRYIEEDQPVHIMVERNEGDRVICASVTRISPFLNQITRSTEAEIEIDNHERWLAPGMFVPVDILYGQSRQATLVPISALFTDPNTGREGVFVVNRSPEPGAAAPTPPPVEAGSASDLGAPLPVDFRAVTIVARGDMEVAVERLEPGDWVVTIGQDLLSTGRSHARVRSVTWDHVMALQSLRPEELLEAMLQSPAPATTPAS